jgi:DNA-binding response OmpR family regulator
LTAVQLQLANILVVEDEPLIINLVVEVLSERGFAVHCRRRCRCSPAALAL